MQLSKHCLLRWRMTVLFLMAKLTYKATGICSRLDQEAFAADLRKKHLQQT